VTSIRLPAEWEPQAAIWLAWPHSRDTWPGRVVSKSQASALRSTPRFDAIPPFFARWAQLIAEDTPVRILGRRDDDASRQLGGSNIQWLDVPTNDCWIRDYGPTFVFHSDLPTADACRLQAIDWRYNAWGGKYPPWDDDDAVASRLARHLQIPVVRNELCLEGGALETDGTGRLLTTKSCLVTPTRNPDLLTEEIERGLRESLGLREVVWLDGGLAGDDTDGHIDQLARFIDPQNIVVAACHDTSDENHSLLAGLGDQLVRWADQTDPQPVIHSLPIPPARKIDGQRVPESYCNFLWLSRTRLLVPTFGHQLSDDRALGILRDLVAAYGTDVIGIDCRDLIWGLGALHCASRDQPASAF
tara:strand:+ start:1087833 stop:1088909 length:1077 start_codon:yes stop_codon:yes gene_type:complete